MRELYERFNLSPDSIRSIEKVKRTYPMKISRYYLDLIKEVGDPIWKQCVPSQEELLDSVNEEDPLLEERYTPVPFLVHRYPDRALLLVSNRCAMYCRFCTRKRKVGKINDITEDHILEAVGYIRQHPEIRDVIVSGGDPLMLKDHELEFVLRKLRSIPHVEIIRIGTRVPCTLPMRVTRRLANMLKKYQPLYVNVHFEHPMEITPESRKACRLLADAGICLGNQTVLLKGVNDDPKVLKELFSKLLQMRVRPYYIYQADQVKGTEHFRTTVQHGMEIMESLYGHTSGLCVPQYVIDTNGGGKIPVVPEFIRYKSKEKLILRNFEGRHVEYINPASENPAKEEFRVAVACNIRRPAKEGMPKDQYAEFDDLSVPLAIKDALDKAGFYSELVEADQDFSDNIRKGDYSFVFNIAEGINGESRESHVPATLEMLGIPYTGSGVLAQAITLDKARTKEILLHHGIHTPKYQVFSSCLQKKSDDLEFPLIVKPIAEGSSKGITNESLVNDEEQLKEQVRIITSVYKQSAIAEEYLEGREFTVAVLGNSNPKVLPIVEITFDYLPEGINRFDSHEVKWFWDSPDNPIDPVVCPAKITRSLENSIRNAALRTFKALGCRDLARIDMRLDNRGIPNVLEVNALPGLIPDPKENSRFPKACYAAGMSYDDMILAIMKEAMKRNRINDRSVLSVGGLHVC